MVTEFPIFGKLTLKDKQSLDNFNAQFPLYADWSYGTLMTWWDAFDDLEVATINGNLLIKSSYLSMGKVPQLVLLGSNNIDESIEQIFSYQKDQGLTPELYSLPQYTIDAIKNKEHYIIVDDPNAAEYVLDAQMHKALEGPQMYGIKKKVAQFQRSTVDHLVELTHIPLDNLPAKMLLINSLHTWRDIYRNDNERLEGMIIDRALLTAEEIDLQCLALFIDKQLQGFALYKNLSDGAINVCHIKTSFAYPNIFGFIMNSVAQLAHAQGVKHMNIEQDLGIEGLRTYKTRLHPVQMLHKYNVYPR